LTAAPVSTVGQDATRHPILRRWEGTAPVAQNPDPATDGYLPLEDGVEVRFSPGNFQTGDYWMIPARTATGLQEPGVVELADGRVFSWMRTDQGAQFGSYSTDGGKSCPMPEATALSSPASPASIKRLPGSTDLLAVYNDHSGRFHFPKGKRTPLVAAISSDSGKTWPRRKPIESDPDGCFCYTAMHFTEKAVLLAYCAGDPKIGGLNRLRIRRIALDWIQSETP